MALKKIILKNHLLLIVLGGFALRLFFYLIGARVYYGKADFFISGDTASWVESIKNLIEHGTYSVDLNKPTGYFFRPPGYSFFIGLFYLLAGKNIFLAYKFIIWIQLLLDVVCIGLIYKIVNNAFSNKVWATTSALLYAGYPFIIVWTPIVYAESTSVFFLMAGLWFFINDKYKYHYFLSGLLIGIATLTRLQIIFIFPAIALAMAIQHRKKLQPFFQFIIPFAFSFIISYGLWPVRNYVLHDTVMFSQDLSAVACWDKDIMGYRDYIFSVKTDWDPQMTQIMKGEKVEWPAASYLFPADTVQLNRAAKLCHDCGVGFNVFMKNAGYRNGYLPDDSSCSEEIGQLFNELTEHQKKHNQLNVYLWVPLGNLYKCFFKSGLYNPSSKIVNLVSTLLFGYRSALILLGLLGFILYYRTNKKFPVLLNIIFLFFIFSYLSLSFVYRNMEMRFLIQTDLLLLIPAGYFFYFLYQKYFVLKK